MVLKPTFSLPEGVVSENRKPADNRRAAQIVCGSQEAKEQFGHAKSYRNLNHGSFGTYPISLRPTVRHFQDQAEERPDVFIRYEYPKLLDRSREAISRLIKAPVDCCVLVPNASTAFNTILRNIVFEEGDVIVYATAIYGACEKTIAYLTESTAVESKKIEYTLPLSHDEISGLFEDTFKQIKAAGKNAKLAVFDTICSAPGVRMPFERLTALCRKHGVLSCIDGAHSLGQIAMDISTLDPDFYFSNLHKWLHVPRGCCLLYVPQRHQDMMRSTLPTSHGFEPLPRDGAAVITNPLPASTKPHFVRNFEFVGTLDNTPYLCVPAALEWRQRWVHGALQGEEAILTYLTQLAREAGQVSKAILGTEILENADGTLGDCAFSNVRLPLSFKDDAGSDLSTAMKIGQWISKVLVVEYDTFIAIMWHGNTWWARLSAQIYLDAADFEWGADALKAVCERARAGEWSLEA